MKFQALKEFRNHDGGTTPRWLPQLAIASLGGIVTVGALLAVIRLSV
jgi:hypothetical protein